MIWIGIDPGLDGCLCLMTHDAVIFVDMPTVTLAGAKKSHRELDLHVITETLKRWCCGAVDGESGLCVAIERQQAMPASLNGRGQGSVSTFRTGCGYGMLLGVLVALGIPHEIISPVSWKKKLMADMPKDKDASRALARRLFPHIADQLNLKKHHGRAESLLIAEFTKRKRGL